MNNVETIRDERSVAHDSGSEGRVLTSAHGLVTPLSRRRSADEPVARAFRYARSLRWFPLSLVLAAHPPKVPCVPAVMGGGKLNEM